MKKQLDERAGRLLSKAEEAPAGEAIIDCVLSIGEMLIEKNRKYGNSALEPIQVFSDLGAKEGVLLRLDDKLKRLKNGAADEDEDVLLDIVGYIVLLLIQRDKQ
jgi:hypothetical protein